MFRIGLTGCAIGALIHSAAAADCGMRLLKRHSDGHATRIYESIAGTASVYFRANVDVNTDGAARSYHPNDPRGQSLALNNIANAITGIWDASGHPIDCRPRRGACFTRYIETFGAARDAQWSPTGHPRVTTSGIIPWRLDPQLGRRVPCTIADGPYRGYFVSQTSFVVDPSKPECDQARYLDSLSFAAAVMPKGAVWTALGKSVRSGDLVVVHAPALHQTAYAIMGDTGPADSIGEGSVALAARLRQASLPLTATYAQVKALAVEDAQYLIFAGANVRTLLPNGFTQADVDRVGAALFERQWGGATRLAECAALPR